MEQEQNTRVLVVDDDRSTRFVLRAILRKSGLEVEEAENGEEALERIHEFEPHVVLLDILMPGVAGNELVETILEWKSQTKVIMVTSVNREEIWKECLKKGAFEVLLKPVTSERLIASIQKALEKHGGTP